MAITETSAKAVKIYNPQAILITPYNGEAKGTDTYKMMDILRDSTTLTQDDPEENKVENEIGSAPIVNNIKLGSYTFATRIGDMQPALLKGIAGFVEDVNSHKLYAPEAYKEVFAEIVLVFQSGGATVATILPKVQLNPKVTLESITSSVGTIDINGIAFNADITDGSKHYTTPFYVDEEYKMPE